MFAQHHQPGLCTTCTYSSSVQLLTTSGLTILPQDLSQDQENSSSAFLYFRMPRSCHTHMTLCARLGCVAHFQPGDHLYCIRHSSIAQLLPVSNPSKHQCSPLLHVSCITEIHVTKIMILMQRKTDEWRQCIHICPTCVKMTHAHLSIQASCVVLHIEWQKVQCA